MKFIIASLAFLLVGLNSCITISTFDQYAYMQTTSLKVDALNLMNKAIDSFSYYEIEIQDMNIKFQKMYEYEKNRPNNRITISMWDTLMNRRTLYGGFITLWKDQGKISRATIKSAVNEVGSNFDRIAQLESKKIKS